MKLGSLRSVSSGKTPLGDSASRDGILCVVKRDLTKAVRVVDVAPQLPKTLREALESWDKVKPALEKIALDLEQGKLAAEFIVDEKQFLSPLPRAFQWVDGSAFLHHVKLVRQARGAEMPESFYSDPLMYQGCSDDFLAPTDPVPQVDFKHGTDFEGEVAVVTTDVPLGVSADAALKHVALIMIVNDVSLRGLIPDELAKGFGFFQSKPQSSFGPFAVTPDELGPAWSEGRVKLPLDVEFNGSFFGKANAGAMHFHFGQLIAHTARTRTVAAGSIIGSGTVSNEDPAMGSSCLAEKRMIEKLGHGEIKTPFMKVGDRVRIEMKNPDGTSIFGAIDQRVAQA